MDGNKSVTANFTPLQYTLSTSVVGQGLVTKNPDQPTYSYGQQVTLTPTPTTGWSFSSWSGSCTGSGACVVTVDENESVTATFTQDHYILTVTSLHGVVSRVPNQATYTYGQTVVLTMGTVELGWTFTGWSGGGCTGIAPCTVTMNGDITVTASFTQIEYSLAINILPNTDGGMVTKNPDKATYHYGEVVQLTAYPASGWHFGNWSGGVIGSDNPTSITIDGNKSVTATFVQEEYDLTITVVGNGHVDINYQGPYHYHDIVIMTAVPDTGWVFFEWSGARTGPNNPMSVTINADTFVTATFNPIPYTFSTSVVGQGTVSKDPEKSTYIYGDVVTVTPTPAVGWSFSSWSGSCTGTGACVVTVDGNETVEATFTGSNWSENWDAYANGQQMHGVNGWQGWDNNPAAGALVSDVQSHSSTNAIDISGATDLVHKYAGYTSGKWIYTAWQYIPTNFSGTTYFIMLNQYNDGGPYNWSVEVKLDSGTNQISNDGPAGGVLPIIRDSWVAIRVEIDLTNDVLTFIYGDQQLFTGTWTGGMSSAGALNIAALDLYANGASPVYYDDLSLKPAQVLTTSVIGSGTITRDPNQNWYASGEMVDLTAVQVTGWHFVEWTGACLGTIETTCSVTMDADKTVGAMFAIDTYALNVTIVGSGTVSKDPNEETYTLGTTVTLTPIAASGETFIGWSGDNGGELVDIGGGSWTIVMNAAKSVTANFTQTTYALTVTIAPPGGGMVGLNPENGPYANGTTVTLTPVATVGYAFSSWSGDNAGELVDIGAGSWTIVMNAAKSVTATFTEDLNLTLPQNLILTEGTLRENFETLNGWTVKGSGSGYSAALDTINFKEGAASIILTTPSNGYVSISKPVTWDLSADQGNLRFWVYVSGSSAPTGGGIILSSDSLQKNYFISYYGNAFRLFYRPGWNLINLRTSDWSTVGSPNWANIVNLRIQLNSTSVNTYSFDALTSGVISQPVVVFTFDKGLGSLYNQAFSYMQTHNVRGTSYIPTSLVGGTGQITWAQLPGDV